MSDQISSHLGTVGKFSSIRAENAYVVGKICHIPEKQEFFRVGEIIFPTGEKIPPAASDDHSCLLDVYLNLWADIFSDGIDGIEKGACYVRR